MQVAEGIVTCTQCGVSWYNYHGQWIAINKPGKSPAVHNGKKHGASEAERFKSASRARPRHNKNLCKQCRRCEEHCPRRAIRRVSGALTIDTTRCNNCRKCVGLCSIGALR